MQSFTSCYLVPLHTPLCKFLIRVEDGLFDCGWANEQVWRNCLFYSGEKDDATSMAREVSDVFDSLFADRILAQTLQNSTHAPPTPEVILHGCTTAPPALVATK